MAALYISRSDAARFKGVGVQVLGFTNVGPSSPRPSKHEDSKNLNSSHRPENREPLTLNPNPKSNPRLLVPERRRASQTLCILEAVWGLEFRVMECWRSTLGFGGFGDADHMLGVLSESHSAPCLLAAKLWHKPHGAPQARGGRTFKPKKLTALSPSMGLGFRVLSIPQAVRKNKVRRPAAVTVK